MGPHLNLHHSTFQHLYHTSLTKQPSIYPARWPLPLALKGQVVVAAFKEVMASYNRIKNRLPKWFFSPAVVSDLQDSFINIAHYFLQVLTHQGGKVKTVAAAAQMKKIISTQRRGQWPVLLLYSQLVSGQSFLDCPWLRPHLFPWKERLKCKTRKGCWKSSFEFEAGV